METLITIVELKDQIEKALAHPLYTVIVSGQQRLYAKSCKGQLGKWIIVYAVVT